VFVYETLRSAAWYWATVAEPVRVNAPVVALKAPVMPFCAVNASASWAGLKLPEIAIVAPARLTLSTSVTVRPGSAATAPSPAWYVSADAVIATTGGLFAAATVIARIAVFDAAVPSFATTDTVRVNVDGFVLALA